PPERPVEWIARREREARRRLRVVLQRVQHALRQVELLPFRNRQLLCVVVVELAAEDREAQLQRTVERIRLRESELHISLELAYIGLCRERFAFAQQVVRLVVDPNERTLQSAHASR